MVDRLVAVDDADYRLPEPVLGALADTFAGLTPMGIVLPEGATHAEIQAACDSAVTFGTRVWAAGEITTSSTLTINSDADLGGLTINYTGSSVAVTLGTLSGVALRINVVAPRVIAANKAGVGWASVAGTTGIQAVNLNSCASIVIPHIQGFESGLVVFGKGQGISYNTFFIGHLANNKRNQVLTADAAGWSNQNTFVGGRYGHDSGEGTNVSGVRQIEMVAGLANPINNNTWLNPSLEGNTAEFIVDFAGVVNVIQNGRYEAATPRIRWQANTTGCAIFYGYNSEVLTQTWLAGASRNHIYSPQNMQLPMGQGLRLENTASSANNVLTVLGAGATAAGSDPTTAYCVGVSANLVRFKRATDTYDRVQIDPVNGRLYLGDSVAAPATYLSGQSGFMFLNNGTLGFATDNTKDIGAASSLRPRDIHVGRNVAQGGYHDMAEMTAPSAPAANNARVYVDDSGGKSRLMVRFATGAAVQIAIEP